jgi:hypothetical protein
MCMRAACRCKGAIDDPDPELSDAKSRYIGKWVARGPLVSKPDRIYDVERTEDRQFLVVLGGKDPIKLLAANVETVPFWKIPEKDLLYNADPNCNHDIRPQSSGVKCSKCPGWFCL